MQIVKFRHRDRWRDILTVILALGIVCCLMEISAFHVCGQDGAEVSPPTDRPYLVLLGIAQDAGFPQTGCEKECCRAAWKDPAMHRYPCSMAIIDPISRQRFMIECTPDFKHQLQMLVDHSWPTPANEPVLGGIFLTHAHIGHYAGLIHLGREVIGSYEIPVHVMPRMQKFLEQNGPWNQLLELNNIQLQPLQADQPVTLNQRISLTPIQVPHRGEYSETVAFIIQGPQQRVLFLPDIDRWEDWDRAIENVIQEFDILFLDGTFLSDGELPGRDMTKIPHPTIQQSLERMAKLPLSQRNKVHFIHFNHTNPLLQPESSHPIIEVLKKSGMKAGVQGQLISL